MSTSATEERITRAQELGLPTNVEETTTERGCERPAIESVWYTKNGSIPFPLSVEHAVLFNMNGEGGQCLFPSEKEAIAESRKHALQIRERWQQVINSLDTRYDAIEDEEMAQEKRRINDPD